MSIHEYQKKKETIPPENYTERFQTKTMEVINGEIVVKAQKRYCY